MTALGSLLLGRRSAENPARPLTDVTLVDALGGGGITEAGVSVTTENAYRLTAVYRSIALLAGLIGALPLQSYRRQGDTRTRIRTAVIDNPHPDATAFEVFEYVGQSLLTHGNAYLEKHRDGLGRVAELHPIHPDAVVDVVRKDEWRTPTNKSGKRFCVLEGTTRSWYTPWDILHIPGLSYDGLTGMSPIALARQAIGAGIAAEAFGARMFERNALVPGVLQTDSELKQPAAERLQQMWHEKTSGAANQWKIPVLDRGAKFQPITIPLEHVQFLETRKFSVTEVARLFGLPPHLVGDVERSTSWGSGIEQQNMQMLTFTVDPWLVRIEQRFTREVVADTSQYVRFNRAALLRADTAARFMAYQRAINNSWMSADEIRALEEMDPLPDGQGQVFYRPGNVIPVSQDTDPAAAEES